MELKIIFVSVKNELTDDVLKAARDAGATGATIIPARGSGIHEVKSFLGVTLENQTDLLVFLVETHAVEEILKAVSDAGCFEESGNGIGFVMPVEKAVGLDSQMKAFKKQAGELD